MNNINIEFLEAYKNLDELCKQILSSEKGITEYINEMNSEHRGHYLVPSWKADFKQLKKMRYIRNRLVHEANSFQYNLITIEDINWLQTFYLRILECTDPFSLLYQKIKNKTVTPIENELNNYLQLNKQSKKYSIIIFVIIFIVIILFTIIFSLIILK